MTHAISRADRATAAEAHQSARDAPRRGGAAILGLLLTMVLPEPAGRSLEDVSGEDADSADQATVRVPTMAVTPSPKVPVVDLVAAGDAVATSQD